MAEDQKEFDNFVQCHEAVQIVCRKAVRPCVERVIEDWHLTKQVYLHTSTTHELVTLKPCYTPSCHVMVQKNEDRTEPIQSPICPTLCPNCIQWCHAIESLYWTTVQKHAVPVAWENVKPPKLFQNSVEFAKAFAISLPTDITVASFDDFDEASLLQIMINFGDCHRNDEGVCSEIRKVLGIYYNLSKQRTSETFRVGASERDSFFDSIIDLVYLIEQIYPKYFPREDADRVSMELQNLPVIQITKEMKMRARGPPELKKDTNNGKDSSRGLDELQQPPRAKAPGNPTLEDPFESQHFQTVISQLGVNSLGRMFSVLRGLDHATISQLLQPIVGVSVHQRASNILTHWIAINGNQATRQAIVSGLEKCGCNGSKENLERHWEGYLTKKCVLGDMETIINKGELAWNDLYKMFLSIGLRDFEIELYEGAEQETVNMKSIKVFDAWQNTVPRPTIKDLMDALIHIGNLNTAHVLAEMWGIPAPKIDPAVKGFDKISEHDIQDITNIETNLMHVHLRRLCSALGMSPIQIENAEATSGITDVRLRARSVLRTWLSIEAYSATRRQIIDALTKEHLIEAKEFLEVKWDLASLGLY